MLNLRDCKKTGEQKSFTNGERFFYAHFITSFKKFAQVRKNGQSTLEYFTIITLIIVISAFGISQFFNQGKDSAEVIFNKAVGRMSASAEQYRLKSCGSCSCTAGGITYPCAPAFESIISFPEGLIPSGGGQVTATSEEWRAITGITLAPGMYCYKIMDVDGSCCAFSCIPCRRRTCSVPIIYLTITG